MKFTEGNKAAEKYTEEQAIELFSELLDATANSNVLSLQEAYISFGMPSVTYYYLLKKFPVLESYKKAMSDIVISRINRDALLGNFNPATSIWRMKQLGERDTQYQEVNTTMYQEIDYSKLSTDALEEIVKQLKDDKSR